MGVEKNNKNRLKTTTRRQRVRGKKTRSFFLAKKIFFEKKRVGQPALTLKIGIPFMQKCSSTFLYVHQNLLGKSPDGSPTSPFALCGDVRFRLRFGRDLESVSACGRTSSDPDTSGNLSENEIRFRL